MGNLEEKAMAERSIRGSFNLGALHCRGVSARPTPFLRQNRWRMGGPGGTVCYRADIEGRARIDQSVVAAYVDGVEGREYPGVCWSQCTRRGLPA
jgi:hypothetical protein